jgi:predicted alpha/beta superfamily hydrolase
MLTLIAIPLLIQGCGGLDGDVTLATIPNTEVRYLQSSFVDQEFRIYVGYPSGHVESDDPDVPAPTYPVLYVLDANLAFAMATELMRLMQLGSDVPPLLLVGIGYPVGGYEETMNLRTRDYTPTYDQRYVDFSKSMTGDDNVTSGGAEAFLGFIRDELKPFIEDNYPADPGDATLFGDSFGGLFATYTLFHDPDTFQRYIVGSPSLWWNDKVSLEFEARYAETHDDLDARVFIAAGGLENAEEIAKQMATFPEPIRRANEAFVASMGTPQMVELIEPFVETLRSRGYPGLELDTHIFPRETHTSVPASTFTRGLRVLFGGYGAK